MTCPQALPENQERGLVTLSHVHITCQSCALCDHMLASYCWQWHYRVDEQILLWSDCRQILLHVGKSKLSMHKYTPSFWNLRFTKSLLATFPFLNGLRTSLLLSCVCGPFFYFVIGMNMIPLLQTTTADTAHTGLLQLWPCRPFSLFSGVTWEQG